jgi:hypothetical protein
LESLGAANTVEPFWRRLPEAFKYPLNSSSMSLIVGTSIISVLATLMPFLLILSVLMYLFAAGSILKYSFSCLERTALGEMKAPDVMDAYQGGIKLLFQLVLITIILSAVVGIAGYYLGNAIGGFLLVVVVFSFPAILIRFAQTENMLEAMNPLHALGLIAAIGLPYGLLIASTDWPIVPCYFLFAAICYFKLLHGGFVSPYGLYVVSISGAVGLHRRRG